MMMDNTKKKFKRDMTRGGARLMICLALALMLLVQPAAAADNAEKPRTVDPLKNKYNYSAITYDTSNGMPTSEANGLAMTKGGFLWIGSYGGLIRYDGNNFVRIDNRHGVESVGCIFTDSKDRLWIGMNENGVALRERGEYGEKTTASRHPRCAR